MNPKNTKNNAVGDWVCACAAPRLVNGCVREQQKKKERGSILNSLPVKSTACVPTSTHSNGVFITWMCITSSSSSSSKRTLKSSLQSESAGHGRGESSWLLSSTTTTTALPSERSVERSRWRPQHKSGSRSRSRE